MAEPISTTKWRRPNANRRGPSSWIIIRKHLDEYSFPAQREVPTDRGQLPQARWKREAFAVFEKVVEALKRYNGENFGAVARKFSDGAEAEQGGQWDWTRQGSLTDKALDKRLLKLPVGAISEPIVGEDAFRLVKINDRRLAGRVPFSEVQEKIKKAIEEVARTIDQGEEVLRPTAQTPSSRPSSTRSAPRRTTTSCPSNRAIARSLRPFDRSISANPRTTCIAVANALVRAASRSRDQLCATRTPLRS